MVVVRSSNFWVQTEPLNSVCPFSASVNSEYKIENIGKTFCSSN